jgi:hypothetical protein
MDPAPWSNDCVRVAVDEKPIRRCEQCGQVLPEGKLSTTKRCSETCRTRNRRKLSGVQRRRRRSTAIALYEPPRVS